MDDICSWSGHIFSAPYGWQQHGFVGALALGSVGFALSAVRRKPGLGAAIVALSTLLR